MHIGIDARFLTHPQAGGFKTYTQNLVTALAQEDRENEYRLYVDREPSQPLAYGPNFRVCVVPGTLPMLGMVWREQVGLARQAGRDKLDLLHAPNLTAPLRCPCPTIITVHDMIWMWPERFSPGKTASSKRDLMRRYYQDVPRRAAQAAAGIITVSEASKDDIVRDLGIPAGRIHVTYEAAGAAYGPVSDAGALAGVRQKFDLPPQFLLALGSADPRKNIAGLVEAYARLPLPMQEKHPLAIVWTHAHLAESLAAQAERLGVTPRLRFLRNVSDADLVLLYNATSLFVFPSRYEGFGLPLLEAMACGTPVVAADNSSIPEIAGDAARLVNAEDPAALSEAIAAVLADDGLRAEMSRRGLAQAARFSWARCARETRDVYMHTVTGT